ncbi:MAG TPA: TolC family protein [Burkholderiales bacterium]|jgi:outer membrane protein TolC|nr:TolC family protein [Burkholderiales bacterium]
MRLFFASAAFRSCFAACFLFLLSTGASHAADALSLTDAQRIAADRSRQLAAQDRAVFASREMAVAAAQLPDPTLKAGVENLPVNGADAFSLTKDFMTMRRIGVMQEFTRSEKRLLRAEKFEREAERTTTEKAATLATVQRDTALAWLDRYFAEAMAAVVIEQTKAARLEIEAAETAYRAGRGNQAEIFAARTAVVSLEDRASETDRRVRTAKNSLARWVGEVADKPLGTKPGIDALSHLNAHDLDNQLVNHPEIASLAKQVEIARTEARLAQANKQPDVTAELMYAQRGPAYSNMVSFGIAIPLQWDQKNRQNREVAAKLAMAEQAEAQREEMLRAHVAEVRNMVNEWENLKERRARYSRELLPLSAQRTEAVTTAYRGARSTLGEVFAARRNEIDVRLQALQLEAEQARIWAQLNFLIPHSTVALENAR